MGGIKPEIIKMGTFILIITIVVAVHAYLFWHIWNIVPLSSVWKTVIISMCLLSFLSLFLYLSPVMDKLPLWIARIIYEVGTSWLIILLYSVILFLLLDIGRAVHLVPATLMKNSLPGTLGTVLLIIALLFVGNVRYNHKQLNKISLKSEKIKKQTKIIFISDLHLGYHNPRSEFHRWIELINKENPDLILIGGDIIDGNIHPLDVEKTWEEFKNFNAPVYACLGNHEYLAGREKSIAFYKKAGINLMTDRSELISDIIIIGRDDRSNNNRKPLLELYNQSLKNKFTILLDHQPSDLQEASKLGIDLQLSGHTHYGQVWPISWITDMVYECAYGQYKKDKTDYYISSGMGIWGGKFRIGTVSEYVLITIN